MPDKAELQRYLAPSRFIDSGHPEVVTRAVEIAGTGTDLERAIRLYYWSRDNVRYNPYLGATEPDHYLGSFTLASQVGWCVPKAILLAALCRAAGIPARVGYADVCNHLSTERLRAFMKTDIFYFHGYTSLFLEGRWVKATPAFNIELCEKFSLRPLEFNGREDSLYHEFDVAGNRHMEYLNDRGEYLDLPFQDLMSTMRAHYPGMLAPGETDAGVTADSWDADVAREVGG